MTNYNDGNWWGWNGGECPVHPETEVTVTYPNGAVCLNAVASSHRWEGPILFRVTKEHREPREWWADPETGQLCKSSYGRFTVKVREVLDE